jgi:hypothetical protein
MDEVIMDQLIPFHKQNKKVKNEKMIDHPFLKPNTPNETWL